MVKLVNQEISKKLDELISFIKEQNHYKRYLLVEEQLQKNEEITSCIDSIKAIQKEMVKREIKRESIASLQEEYQNLLQRLNGYPIYQEYQELQQELNEEFQYIKRTLETYFQEKIQS